MKRPFLFLVFGRDRSLLIDTEAGETHVARKVSQLIDKWSRKHHHDSLPLLVGHSHCHDDHIGGDEQFRARANTTMVPLTVEGTQKFFGISQLPEDTGQIDLDGPILDVVPIPRHDALSVAYYGRQTGVILTGDSVYPGLYVRDFPAFVKSTQRLIRFTDGKTLTHLLGNHIEQSRTPHLDYKIGTTYQPDEHSLELGRGALLELKDALAHMQAPVRRAFRDFTIWPVGDPAGAATGLNI